MPGVGGVKRAVGRERVHSPFALLNHLIRSRQYRWRDREPQRLGGLGVDDNLERGGCSTGRSAGLAPLRIVSTYSAAWRNCSVKFDPYDISPPAAT
jgi:hypothetical protein